MLHSRASVFACNAARLCRISRPTVCARVPGSGAEGLALPCTLLGDGACFSSSPSRDHKTLQPLQPVGAESVFDKLRRGSDGPPASRHERITLAVEEEEEFPGRGSKRMNTGWWLMLRSHMSGINTERLPMSRHELKEEEAASTAPDRKLDSDEEQGPRGTHRSQKKTGALFIAADTGNVGTKRKIKGRAVENLSSMDVGLHPTPSRATQRQRAQGPRDKKVRKGYGALPSWDN